MAKDKIKPIVVHHGRWNSIYVSKPPLPHEVSDTFHAGTQRSALDRIRDTTPRDPSKSQPTIYTYEIHPKDISKLRYTDSVYKKEWGDATGIKEAYSPELNVEGLLLEVERTTPETVIKKYTNLAEDKGSTSYRIPSNLVNLGKVRHLGIQFLDYGNEE